MITRIKVPNARRSAVTPGAPTNGNSDFASEAPLWIETMAIKMTSIGSHAGILRDEPGILSPVRVCQMR